jgi:hypothetical protein
MKYSNARAELRAEMMTLALPVNTPASEVLDRWIMAVVARVGTQLEASRHLGLTPATISRRLNHRRQTKRATE